MGRGQIGQVCLFLSSSLSSSDQLLAHNHILKSQGVINDDDFDSNDRADNRNKVVEMLEMETHRVKRCFQSTANVDKTLRREEVAT